MSYEGNRDRFTGFAGDYDRYRLRPPEALAEIVSRYAGLETPELVVDLGCGTGLSTRFWADRAAQVIGVDPAPDMLERARTATQESNVVYRGGYGHETGLPSACTDIVTCSQSFHWMEPSSTLAEIARILRPDGVFCAYHYEMPAATGIEALDLQLIRTSDRVDQLEREHDLRRATRFFGKDEHLASLTESGRFRLVRRLGLHNVDWTSAERLVRGFETLGALQTLRKRGVTDEAMALTDLRDVARVCLEDERAPLYVSYTAHLGVGLA